MTERWTVEQAEKARGCWLEGSRGWTANGVLVNMADELGMPLDDDDRAIVRHYLASDDKPLTLSTGETVNAEDISGFVVDQGELSDKATDWLNENIAPDGWMFGWESGEFLLQDDEWWQSVTE